MTKLAMNFAPRSFWFRPAIGLLVMGMFVSLYALWDRDALLGQRDTLWSQWSQLQNVQDHWEKQHVKPQKIQTEDPKVTALVQQISLDLNRPWGLMLDSIQVAKGTELFIVNIQSESNPNFLRINGQTNDSQAVLRFIQRLKTDPLWRSVELVNESHQPATATTSLDTKAMSFQLLVERRAL
ncbi:hypothetical protein [Aquirhabdus sp.]|uniref:hypothetical protein n=1 Tax=Aquirhabdus sp. TaxID=2824160 RepID=UPI00396CCE76